jgi:hypothetical protein
MTVSNLSPERTIGIHDGSNAAKWRRPVSWSSIAVLIALIAPHSEANAIVDNREISAWRESMRVCCTTIGWSDSKTEA